MGISRLNAIAETIEVKLKLFLYVDMHEGTKCRTPFAQDSKSAKNQPASAENRHNQRHVAFRIEIDLNRSQPSMGFQARHPRIPDGG